MRMQLHLIEKVVFIENPIADEANLFNRTCGPLVHVNRHFQAIALNRGRGLGDDDAVKTLG